MHSFSDDTDLVDLGELTEDDRAQCMRVMDGMRNWQAAARALSAASKRYMKLNESDMRAIRMMIRAQRKNQIVTPKEIAHEVGISSASTTKLVDRLIESGHLIRKPHPTDRRTTSIEVTEHTRRSAEDSIGRQHARRFSAAASMSPQERNVVIRFFDALTEADAPQGPLAMED
ncbi:Transcriptional regulator, MarR family [Microbacterium esteraromaticum]|uniref:Transcriptional regulator, MarR family n=1 Tax=Microbacterium esteraromaticum TaxID=57043 RepID=A0A1R4KC34_9MICO|nr:Transcriptional regulator, MarR family [Microbacterium esteraromaticum]